MNFRGRMKNYNRTEDGAVTVDWVVLTAALVALVLSAVPGIYAATVGQSGSIDTMLKKHGDDIFGDGKSGS